LRPIILIYHTVSVLRRVAAQHPAAKIVGLGVSKLILTICFLAGVPRPRRHDRSRGRAGPHQRQPRRRLRLYRILVAFWRAESAPIIPWRSCSRHQRQRRLASARLGLPDASVQVLQGIIFVFRAGERRAVRRIGFLKGKSDMRMDRSDSGTSRSPCSAAPSASRHRFCS